MAHLKRLLPALALVGLMAGSGFGFEITECDGTDGPGNAGILLGWAQPTAASMVDIAVDDEGAQESGLTTAQIQTAFDNGFTAWDAVTFSNLAFPPRTMRAVTDIEVGDALTLGQPVASMVCTVISSDSTIPGGATGWTPITGTGNTLLGLTITEISLATRLITKSSLLLNDDITNGASGFFTGASGVGGHDLDSVIEHEIGHWIGGGHTANAASLMFPSLGALTVKPLTPDDLNIARFLYPTQPNPTPPTSNNLNFLDCFTLAASGTVNAPPHPGGCELSVGRGGFPLPFVGAMLLLLLTGCAGRVSRR